MRLLVVPAFVFLASCSSTTGPTPPAAQATASTEPWYGETLEQLKSLSRDAETLVRKGEADKAAEVITKGQPLITRLLSVRQPTVAALEAASDLDELYGQMLLSNRHYGWARLQFQKNLARWKYQQPQTAEASRRIKLAQAGIAECDRHLGE